MREAWEINHHFPLLASAAPTIPRPHGVTPGSQSPLFPYQIFLLFLFFFLFVPFQVFGFSFSDERSRIKLFNRSHQAYVSFLHRWLNNIQGFLESWVYLGCAQMKVIPSVRKEGAGILFLSCTLVFNVTINNENIVHCRSTTYVLNDHLKFIVTDDSVYVWRCLCSLDTHRQCVLF